LTHIVTAPLVSIKDTTGSPKYFYQGTTVPEGFDKDDIARLVEAGLIEKAEAEAKPAARSGK